jgi:hypothetical protein
MNDNLQDELGRTLHRQADGVSGAPISFEAVRGTAGRIRNRRRAMAAGAVLAVGAAIVAPTAIMGGLGEDRGNPPVVTDPTPTPSGDATATTPEGLTLRGLERGDAPQVPWVEGRTLHVGSETVGMPVSERMQDVVVLDDVLVLRGFAPQGSGSDAAVYVVDRDTDEVLHQELSHHTPLVVNAAGTAAAWMSEDGIPRVWQTGAAVPIDYAASGSGSNHKAVALVGERCDADAETVAGAGCSVLFTQESPQTGEVTSWSSPTHGNVDRWGGPFDWLIDASGGRDTVYAGFTEVGDGHTCSGLSGPHDASVTWRTCDHQLQQFSPDGSLLLAHEPYFDGVGPGTIAVLDARTQDVLVDRDNHDSHAFIGGAVWEDEGHVLATVFQEGEWAIVRVGVDGSMELASDIQQGEDVDAPFFLSTQP